jgi:hypothetical protein
LARNLNIYIYIYLYLYIYIYSERDRESDGDEGGRERCGGEATGCSASIAAEEGGVQRRGEEEKRLKGGTH